MGLCQRPTTHPQISGYKVLLKSLLPRSLHSLEFAIQVWRIVVTWNARSWKMIMFALALLPWRKLFSWLLFLTNVPWPPANHMLKGTCHRAHFQKIPFASTFFAQLFAKPFFNCSTYEFPYLDAWKRKYSPHVHFFFGDSSSVVAYTELEWGGASESSSGITLLQRQLWRTLRICRRGFIFCTLSSGCARDWPCLCAADKHEIQIYLPTRYSIENYFLLVA